MTKIEEMSEREVARLALSRSPPIDPKWPRSGEGPTRFFVAVCRVCWLPIWAGSTSASDRVVDEVVVHDWPGTPVVRLCDACGAMLAEASPSVRMLILRLSTRTLELAARVALLEGDE